MDVPFSHFPCFSFFAVVFALSVLNSCYCFKTKNMKFPVTEPDWLPADATWYGSPTGAGSDGGACAYGNSVGQPPFSAMVAAGGPSLFKAGKGCGACYQVNCNSNPSCSGKPVTLVITDECPGGACLDESVHFDISGSAFGAMAVSGQADQLRNAGILQIEYMRVGCNYSGQNISFYVDAGSNPYYFSVVVEYEGEDGDLAAVDLKETPSTASDSKDWSTMQQSWGADWRFNSGSQLQAPFSLRLTSLKSGQTLVAINVIPVGWTPCATYHSFINYGK